MTISEMRKKVHHKYQGAEASTEQDLPNLVGKTIGSVYLQKHQEKTTKIKKPSP